MLLHRWPVYHQHLEEYHYRAADLDVAEEGSDGSPATAPAPNESLKPSGGAGKFVPPHLRNKV